MDIYAWPPLLAQLQSDNGTILDMANGDLLAVELSPSVGYGSGNTPLERDFFSGNDKMEVLQPGKC